jgi:hypothetical protein
MKVIDDFPSHFAFSCFIVPPQRKEMDAMIKVADIILQVL